MSFGIRIHPHAAAGTPPSEGDVPAVRIFKYSGSEGLKGASGVLVRQAISRFGTGADPDIVGLAHEVVVVGAFRALACTDMRQDFGESSHERGVNEGGAGCVVRGSANGDPEGSAAMMVESAAANAAGGHFGDVFGHCSSWWTGNFLDSNSKLLPNTRL